jgi:HPt (histidine-containing phosphotransfer) domain-containing protein
MVMEESRMSPHTPADPERQPDSSIDLPALLEQFGGTREILDQVIDAYLSEYQDMLADVGRAVNARHAASLASSAHRFKGAVAIFGDERAVFPVASLEQAGRTNSLGHIDALYASLSIEVERLSSELRGLRSGH